MHILVRFLTCPFLRVLRRVPPDAKTLLEIGGGHGLFSHLAADRGLLPTVVDPDLRKLFSIGQRGPVTFVGGFDSSVAGRFDVIAILDVLYAIPLAEWRPLLARAFDRLSPGGTLLVKEMDARSWKQKWNRIQESISMTVLRITYAETFNYEPPEVFAEMLRDIGFSVEQVPVGRGYPHPHLLFIAVKPR